MANNAVIDQQADSCCVEEDWNPLARPHCQATDFQGARSAVMSWMGSGRRQHKPRLYNEKVADAQR